MTNEQLATLREGDSVIRVSNGKRYIVSVVHENALYRYVSAQIEKDGKPYGRGWVVKAETFNVA